MLKRIMVGAAIAAISFGVQAQRPAAVRATCPAGTRSATIRHTAIKPGEWATFAKAVADHTAWYAAHKDGTRTVIGRIPTPSGLSATEAVTITYYSGKPMPDRDAAYSAFTAKYRASSTLKDEMRTCLSA